MAYIKSHTQIIIIDHQNIKHKFNCLMTTLRYCYKKISKQYIMLLLTNFMNTLLKESKFINQD